MEIVALEKAVYKLLLKTAEEKRGWHVILPPFKCCKGSREMQATKSDTCGRQTAKAIGTEQLQEETQTKRGEQAKLCSENL